ncbi:MAG: polysaccharide biosynthesis protein [Cellvibrionales bacterium]|jgi:protein-tyrosine kinase|nr:polysaccharide biosynthesis protein [Cellvibrionales bacterium]MBT5923960.1 polysaccharide biosynthesis protein [Cellvibrionales bacterium]MBT6579694.1 polysaccharide biosynthesis protein [Cellvibrionales bacterium]
MSQENKPYDSSKAVVDVREVKDRLSRQEIREMADIFRLGEDDLEEKKLIYPRMRDKRVLNVFRDIRTKLIEKSGNKNFTLMVTSVCEEGGSTFVANNLAASIALDQGKTALIVDCNLYSPASSQLLDGDHIGFSDFLESPTVSIENIIYATGIPRLRLIPIGKSLDISPEYYTSYRMKQFTEELSRRYSDRYVILDVPPVGSTTDARILADCCDFVVLVVPHGKVTKDQLKKSIANFDSDKLIGIIFNN